MSTSRLADHVGRTLGGRYRLIAPVGTGASGQVFLAEDTVLGRRVAVKLLHPALATDTVFLERFEAEARTVAGLNHPHVLGVHDSGDDDGPFIVTEFLGGGTLRAMLDRNGPLTLSQVLLVGLETSRALEYAHRQGLVHRDIKPGNLLFDDEGHLRVADFGLAKALAEASVTEPSGGVVGTARYASPEQARGERLTPASDVYSLALVLVEAATGVVPFDGDTQLGSLMARTAADLAVPDELGALQRIVERAGRLDPAERPDAGELRLSLLGAAEKLPRPEPLPLPGSIDLDGLDDPATTAAADPTMVGVPTPASSPGRARVEPRVPTDTTPGTAGAGERTRRRRWPWLVGLLVLLAGAGVAGYLAWDSAQVVAEPVPELVGTDIGDLSAGIGDFWVVDQRNERQDGTTPGEILRTDPPAATELDEGETLIVYVSLGEQLRTVPQGLVGMSLQDATRVLEAERLTVGTTSPEFSEEDPAGTVLEVLTLERQLEPGSPVDLKVSAGPEPRPVPDGLVGLNLPDARAEIEALGLTAVEVEVYDNNVAAGVVIAVSPDPGTALDVGATVELTVSLGPRPVVIPDVVGLDVVTASGIITDAGLCNGELDGPPDTAVIAADPPVGTTVDAGTCIRLVTTLFG